MKKYPLICMLLFLTAFAKAQNTPPTTGDNQIFTAVEEAATYPGGVREFYNYLSQNIKYPEVAKRNHTEGKVYITFVVEKDGSLSDIKMLRGVSTEIDAEALRVLAASPKWIPGKQNGVPVREQYTVPISFTLPKPVMRMVDTTHTHTDVYTAVEQSAQFPGGQQAFSKFLAKNIMYPAEARRHNIQGKVYLQFIIEKDGSLSNIKVLRGVSTGIDAEAVRVIKSSPNWEPGKQDGRVVREQYVVPIAFILSNYRFR